MKLSDISQKLTEKPGGFGGIVKSKLQQQIPFAKKKQRAGKAKEALYKHARQIKKELQAWKAEAFATTNGEDTQLTMNQFLGWAKKRQPKYSNGIESYARGDKAYAEHFAQAIDKEGKQSSTASDPKVKVRSNDAGQTDTVDPSQEQEDMISPEEMTGEKQKRKLTPDEQAGLDTINRNAEEEAAEYEKQDLKASKGEDKEPKVDTSASIYEARLRALLEDDEDKRDPDIDVGVNAAKTLTDNQVDTLITMGIQKQKELDSGDDDISSDEPSQAPNNNSEEPAQSSASGDFLGEYQGELESVLTKIVKGVDLDKRDQRNASNMLKSL